MRRGRKANVSMEKNIEEEMYYFEDIHLSSLHNV